MPLPDLSNVPKKPLILAGGILIVGVIFFLVSTNLRGGNEGGLQADLTFWGVLDPIEMKDILGSYEALEPGVKIEYRQIDPRNYERTLLDALAAGTGPDMFMIENTALPRHRNKLFPADPTTFDIGRLRALFPTAVESDFSFENQVYALPLYLDTLAMIYNKNLFDQALVVEPPKTWQDFQSIIPRLRSLTSTRQLERAASAIGGSTKTIASATDLLALLMIQNGTPMTGARQGVADFGFETKEAPGLLAFQFYLQFANAGSPYYTWNDNQENYLESFIAGKTAIVFDYHDGLRSIKAKAPFLSVAVSPMLQPAGSELILNHPHYWGIAVSRGSRFAAVGWSFIARTLTDATTMRNYINATGRPPALRAFIGELISNPELGVFAAQALTARSWYQIDDEEIENILDRAIVRALSGAATPETALKEAETQVTEIMQSRKF